MYPHCGNHDKKITPTGISHGEGDFLFIYACLMESEIFSLPPSHLIPNTLTRTV